MKQFSWPPSPVAGCAAASAHSRRWLYAEKWEQTQLSKLVTENLPTVRIHKKQWSPEQWGRKPPPSPVTPTLRVQLKAATGNPSPRVFPPPPPHCPPLRGAKCTLAFHPLSAPLLLNLQRVPGEKRKALTHRRRQAAKLGLESRPVPRQAWGIKGTAGERTKKDLKLWNKGKEKA